MRNQIIQRVGVSSGVRYNIGLALMTADRDQEAATQLELALSDCSNNGAAAEALMACYTKMGRDEDARALAAHWQDADPTAPHDTTATADADGRGQAA